MSKSTKQLFNYAVESVAGDTFRCTTENEKEVIVKYTAYSSSINIDVDVFEKAIKNLNLKEAVILHNTLCVVPNDRISCVYIEHTVLYGTGIQEEE